MGFWNPRRDRQLQRHESAGRSLSQIARLLGTTRNAVIGRSYRLRGIIFPSSVRRNIAAKAAAAARRKARKLVISKAVKGMRRNIARGMPRELAIHRAKRDGATYRAMGEELGVSKQ